MKKLTLFIFTVFMSIAVSAQQYNTDSALKVLNKQKDSSLRAFKTTQDSLYASALHADSVKTNKEFDEKIKWEKIKGIAIYPAIRGSENSGVVPVKDPTEIPDPGMDYKLLFELVMNNPDSVAKEINFGLAEVARVINLHVASGIPLKKIFPVITVHAGALKAITNNEYYRKHFKVDNPNLKLIDDLSKLGAKFIACGQAMAFFDVNKEDLLKDIRISLTSQTVISSYQLKGYVLYKGL